MSTEREKKALFAGAETVSFADVDDKTIDSISLVSEALTEEESVGTTFLFRLPLLKWKTFLLFLGISLGLLFHWFATSELFSVPKDVAATRCEFFKAKESYFQNSTYWDAKQKHFTEKLSDQLSLRNDIDALKQIQEIPGEIFISFMLKKLHLGFERLEKTAIFARDDTSNCSLIISKPETSIWPFSIMLALEVEVKVHAERFSLTVTRLRRGTQDIALSLAWTYFGPELESIRQLEATSKQSFILLSTSENLQ